MPPGLINSSRFADLKSPASRFASRKRIWYYFPMPVPGKHPFTVKEYYRMAEIGILPPNARVELLNGRIIEMSPTSPAHGGTVKRLSRIFNARANGRWLVSTRNPVRLDDHSEPEPDVALLKPAPDDYKSRHPQPEDVFCWLKFPTPRWIMTVRKSRPPMAGRAWPRFGL